MHNPEFLAQLDSTLHLLKSHGYKASKIKLTRENGDVYQFEADLLPSTEPAADEDEDLPKPPTRRQQISASNRRVTSRIIADVDEGPEDA